MENIEQCASEGDPSALMELYQRMTTTKDENEEEALLLAFDRVAMSYAMGKGEDDEDEWPEFCEIVRKYNEMTKYEIQLEHELSTKRSIEFDVRVIERMKSSDPSVQKLMVEERESVPYTLSFCESGIADYTLRKKFCEIWINTAKKCLVSPRFTKLSDEVMDALIQSVAYEMEGDQDKDEPGDDICYHRDDEDKPFEWFDDCAICQGAKKAETEGRNLSERELRQLFDEANWKQDSHTP